MTKFVLAFNGLEHFSVETDDFAEIEKAARNWVALQNDLHPLMRIEAPTAGGRAIMSTAESVQ